jgi:hypothetical protein
MALGTLVTYVSEHINEQMEMLTDIAEEESHHLHELFGNFVEIEDRFGGLAMHYTSRSYKKFKIIWRLLSWSFAEIMEHFSRGDLREMEIPVLCRLVKALFSDSHLRSRNLDILMQGHPA